MYHAIHGRQQNGEVTLHPLQGMGGVHEVVEEKLRVFHCGEMLAKLFHLY